MHPLIRTPFVIGLDSHVALSEPTQVTVHEGLLRQRPAMAHPTAKPQILFVDDDQSILNGLRRSLHVMSKDWDLTFALGGKAALDALASKQFDVLVTDVQMVGIDGLELLAHARDKWPRMTRMVLSGTYDQATIMRTIPD